MPKRVNFTIVLPSTLIKALKIQAALEAPGVSDLIQDALETCLPPKVLKQAKHKPRVG